MERRRRKREAMDASMMEDCFASATKTTVKISGNMDVLADKIDQVILNDAIDEDYELGLLTCVSDIDIDSDSEENGGSDIDVSTGYNSDSDEIDEEYKLHLPTCVSDIDSTSDNDEIDEEEMLRNKLKLDTKMSKDLTHSAGTGNFGNTKSGSMREQTDGPIVSQQSLDIERGPCNKRPCQDISSVSGNDWHHDADEEYQSIPNSDHAFGTPEVQCGVEFDEDYHLFLNPAGIVDKNTTKTTTMEDGSSSSDSDLILEVPNPICENTPFISSKTYDSSCFEKEMNPRDGRQLSADLHSQFRRRLMEYLDSPYHQQEYDVFWDEVSQQRQKERHLETRQGVIILYCEGVNKSYLELYPDLEKAIAEFKEQEPHKVLFLLRGFFFWLQNLCCEGKFKPWCDESCLETLQKM